MHQVPTAQLPDRPALLRDCHPSRLPHCPIVDCQQLGSARLPCCLPSHHGEQLSSATTQTTVNRARHCGPQHACNPCTLDRQSPRTDRNWSQIHHGPDTSSPVRVELFSPTPRRKCERHHFPKKVAWATSLVSQNQLLHQRSKSIMEAPLWSQSSNVLSSSTRSL